MTEELAELEKQKQDREDMEIRKKLLMFTRSSDVFNYLGHLWFTHKKIDGQGMRDWFTWWRKMKPKIERPIKPDEQIPLYEHAIEEFGMTEEDKKREAEEKLEEERQEAEQKKLDELGIPF